MLTRSYADLHSLPSFLPSTHTYIHTYIGAPDVVLFASLCSSGEGDRCSQSLYITLPHASPAADWAYIGRRKTTKTSNRSLIAEDLLFTAMDIPQCCDYCHSLKLPRGEVVLDVSYQPILPTALLMQSMATTTMNIPSSSSSSSSSSDSELRSLQQAWLLDSDSAASSSSSSSGGGPRPLIGVLTSRRVLICTYQLAVLNELIYVEVSSNNDDDDYGSASSSSNGSSSMGGATEDTTTEQLMRDLFNDLSLSSGLRDDARRTKKTGSHPHRSSPSVTRDPAVGLSWLGAALCCVMESGAVRYLLPGSFADHKMKHVSQAAFVGGRGGGGGSGSDSYGGDSIHFDLSAVYRCLGLRHVYTTPKQPYSSSSVGSSSSSTGNSDTTTEGLLCCLPRNISNTLPSSHRIVAILPDRMLVAFLRRDESYYSTTFLPMLAFTQRCINPIEPLILGLVALDNNNNNNNNNNPTNSNNNNYQGNNNNNSSICIPMSSSSSSSSVPDPRLDLISTLLQYYCSPDGTNQSTSHCTNRLLLALMSFQNSERRVAMQSDEGTQTLLHHRELGDDKDRTTITALDRLRVSVASVAGLASRSTRTPGSSDFPAVRWLSSGFKFVVGLNARLPYLSSLDLLSTTRPELLDLLVDAGTYGGMSLPHRQSQTAKQYSACALLMLALSMSSSTASATTSGGGVGEGGGGGGSRYECDQLVPLAKRLLDISGGSAALAAIALYEGLTHGGGGGGDASLIASAKKVIFEEVRWDDKLLYIALRNHLCSLAAITGDGASLSSSIIDGDDDAAAYVHDPSKYMSTKHLLDRTMFMERLGSSSGSSIMRPTSTTTRITPITAHDWSRVTAVDDAMENALTQLQSTQREHFAVSGLGPPLVRSPSMMGSAGGGGGGGSHDDGTGLLLLLPVMGPRCNGE